MMAMFFTIHRIRMIIVSISSIINLSISATYDAREGVCVYVIFQCARHTPERVILQCMCDNLPPQSVCR